MLALILAQQGKFDAARTLIEHGEPQVEDNRVHLVNFLCNKGRVCHLSGDEEGAWAVLAQAQGIAAELKVTEESEVGKALAALLAQLGADQG